MPTSSVTVASYNVHYGYALDGTYDLQRIADDLGDADIVCLQEVTQGLVTGDDQLSILADLLGYRAAYAPGLSVASLGGDPLVRRTFGNAILSRWPITTTATTALPGPYGDGGDDFERSALCCVIATPDGTPIRVVTTHLTHLAPSLRLEQIGGLLDFVGTQVAKVPIVGTVDLVPDAPPLAMQQPWLTLVAGDFNCEPGSEEHTRALAGYAIGADARRPLHDLLADADRPFTYHDPRRGSHGIFDHLLADRDVRQVAWVDYDASGSDHQPIFTRIELPHTGETVATSRVSSTAGTTRRSGGDCGSTALPA